MDPQPSIPTTIRMYSNVRHSVAASLRRASRPQPRSASHETSRQEPSIASGGPYRQVRIEREQQHTYGSRADADVVAIVTPATVGPLRTNQAASSGLCCFGQH